MDDIGRNRRPGRRLVGLFAVLVALGGVLAARTATALSGTTVASGNQHTCAVTSAGAVWCWGANWGGQLGNGTSMPSLTPVPVSPKLPPLEVKALTAGDGHTCALTTAGKVWCWGDNRAGQLGDGTTTTRVTPVAVVGLGDSVVVAIGAGWGHTCAVTSAGAALCWGSNADGQLGDGTTTDALTPVVVSGLASGVAGIAAAPSHTCAVTAGGAAWCWGDNHVGQLGDGTTTDALTPVPVSYLGSGVAAVTTGHLHSCALTSAGAVWCWGSAGGGQLGDGTMTDALTPVSVSGLLSGVTAISAGDAHTCALTSDGAVLCWGSGQLGDGGTQWRLTPAAVTGLGSGVAAIEAGMGHTCAVTGAGAIWCWGVNRNGQLGDGTWTSQLTPVPVSGLGSGVAAVTAAGWNTCIATTAGAAQCWGSNDHGQVGDGTTTWRVAPVPVSGLGSGVTAVSGSGSHACAIASGGALWCWGINWSGQLGDGTTTSRSTPVAVSGLGSGVVAVTARSGHTCAVTGAGAVWCWGGNGSGSLGDGTTTTRLTPVAVSGLGSGVVAVTSGYGHTCALTDAGAVWCWGSNWAGQLGDGTTTDALTPVAVSGLGSGVVAIAAGSIHTCALTSAGAVKCWGENSYGQLGDGTNASQVTPVPVTGLESGVATIAAGSGTTCAVTSGGAAWCWGSNWSGEIGNGSFNWTSTPEPVSGLGSGVQSIATGGEHTCAVTAGGALKCWGLNISGLPGDDEPLIRLTPVQVVGFVGAVPTVTGVSPAVGPTSGGTPVTITGTGFAAGATVTTGGVAATDVVVVSATSITATTGPHAVGSADVVVTNVNAQAATLAGGFTYRAPSVTARPSRDFDGDLQADVAVYRPATGTWFSLDSSSGNTSYRVRGWGVDAQGDTPVVGDFDGDGVVDPTVYRPGTGTWFILESHAGHATWRAIGWGDAADALVPGDYDGDKATDIAVYRPSTGQWFVLPSSTGFGSGWAPITFGDPAKGDVPIAGDFDGDGERDPAVYRPSTGTWFWLKSSAGFAEYEYRGWGVQAQGDTPAPGDYDGDGKTDPTVYRPQYGTWFVLKSSSNYTQQIAYGWGVPGDTPAPADYDGDGRADVAVYRAATGEWFVRPSGGAWPWTVVFGQGGDVPLVAR